MSSAPSPKDLTEAALLPPPSCCGFPLLFMLSDAQKRDKAKVFFAKGKEAQKKGDIVAASESYRMGMDLGHGESAFRLGLLTDPTRQLGKPTPKSKRGDEEKSLGSTMSLLQTSSSKLSDSEFFARMKLCIKYFENAGKLGYGEGYHVLAQIYSFNCKKYRIKEDPEKAIDFFEKAVKAHVPSPGAYYHLGLTRLQEVTTTTKPPKVIRKKNLREAAECFANAYMREGQQRASAMENLIQLKEKADMSDEIWQWLYGNFPGLEEDLNEQMSLSTKRET